MKHIVTLALILTCFTTVKAGYYYDNAIGIGIGNTGGITYKHFLDEEYALDLRVYGNDDFLNFSGEITWNDNLSIDRMHWYLGAGAHAGLSWKNVFNLGLDGAVGLEYTSRNYPINFFLDMKPGFDILVKPKFYWSSNIGIRYVLK